MQRIVITGGPCSGKTTLVTALAARGFATIPEAALQIIEELNEAYGVAGQVKWHQENRAMFQLMVARRQANLEATIEPKAGDCVFCDRGRLDGLAYSRLYGFEVSDKLRNLMITTRYDRVFLLDTLSMYDERPTTGRTSNQALSWQIRDLLGEVYTECGYHPIPVPDLPVERRVEAVLKHLSTLSVTDAGRPDQ